MAFKIKNWLRKSSAKTVQPNSASKFQAVAVSSGLEECCKDAKALSGKRFLMRNAPVLPLKGCNLPVCNCRYVKYEDRRQEPRRDSEYGIRSSFVRDVERRGSGRGRRKTDV